MSSTWCHGVTTCNCPEVLVSPSPLVAVTCIQASNPVYPCGHDASVVGSVTKSTVKAAARLGLPIALLKVITLDCSEPVSGGVARQAQDIFPDISLFDGLS